MTYDLLSSDLTRHFHAYEKDIYRLVEGQYYIATRKLVDSLTEQDALERILDASKPVAPTQNVHGSLHYLLFTPFRYPPLNSGGRFHTRADQSIFYGAEELETAMAEVAYHLFEFIRHSEADFAPMSVPYTHFMARLKTERAIYLTQPPFDAYRADISHPASYAYSQRCGSAMRRAGAELCTFYSARKPDGTNVGVFSPDAFAQNEPIEGKKGGWSLYVSRDVIEFKSDSITNREAFVFPIDYFYVDGVFPLIS